MNFQDIELLSAYLDGQLSPSEVARLEARLSSDTGLKAALADLRSTRGLLRRLPQRRAPRNFRLTPAMAGIKPPEPRAYPIFRFATALAAFLFVASVALNALTPLAAQRLASAPAPVYGMGGGGGGAPPEAAQVPAATQAPALQPFAAAAPTATSESTLSLTAPTGTLPSAEDTARAAGPVATMPANKAVPGQPSSGPIAQAGQAPVPIAWVLGLGILMLVLAAAAWLIKMRSDRHIRDRWTRK